jgi:hypothetical protein
MRGDIAKVLIANGGKMLQPAVQGSLEHLRKDLMEQFNPTKVFSLLKS